MIDIPSLPRVASGQAITGELWNTMVAQLERACRLRPVDPIFLVEDATGRHIGVRPDEGIRVKNNETSETAPAYGVLRISGYESSTGAYTVIKPTSSHHQRNILINSAAPIGPQQYGRATNTYPTPVLYETTDGLATAFHAWGAGPSSWKLRRGKRGFLVVSSGNATTGLVNVVKDLSLSGCTASHSTTQTLADNTLVTLAFNSTGAEQSGSEDYHDNVTNNSRINFPADGLYLVGACGEVTLGGGAAAGSILARLLQTGATVIGPQTTYFPAGTTGLSFLVVAPVVISTASQYVEVQVRQISTVTGTLASLPLFWAIGHQY